jgi:hypothetical protein
MQSNGPLHQVFYLWIILFLFFGLMRILVHEMYIRRAYLARMKQSILPLVSSSQIHSYSQVRIHSRILLHQVYVYSATIIVLCQYTQAYSFYLKYYIVSSFKPIVSQVVQANQGLLIKFLVFEISPRTAGKA